MGANKKQVAGDHYKTEGIQHWDMCYQLRVGYLEGACTKYLSRWRKKNGIQDLKKAEHFLEKLLEVAGSEGYDNPIKRRGAADTIGKFFKDANIHYEDSLIIYTIFTWKTVKHLQNAYDDLELMIATEEDCGPDGAYVDQD